MSIIMEYLPNGNLYEVLHDRNTKLTIVQRYRMALHVCYGIQALHELNVLHRDIKSMNVLVTENYGCKPADFGSAKYRKREYMEDLMTVNIGTPLWMVCITKIK